MKHLLCLLIVAVALVAPVRAADAVPPLLYGTAWYPEQWPEAGWAADRIR